MKDYHQREINYLRVSLTDRCNFRCIYCMDETGVEEKTHEDVLSFEELYYIISTFVSRGVKKVRLTGGEPLIRKGILPFLESLGRLEGIEDLCLTTNGVHLVRYAKQLKAAGVNRVNISLDTLDPITFQKITRWGKLHDVIDGIDAAQAAGMKVKINTVLMKGINDHEIRALVQLTKTRGIDVRFIELMPIGTTKDFARIHFMSGRHVLKQVKLSPLRRDDLHSPATYYRFEDAIGKVGLISPLSNHFCSDCNRLRLTADGKLRPCLLGDMEWDLRTAIRKNANINEIIDEVLLLKPKEHHLQWISPIRGMHTMGG